MSQKPHISVKTTNPYYLLTEIYNSKQVQANDQASGINIGPFTKARNHNFFGAHLQGGFLAGSDFSGSNMSNCNLQAVAISKGKFSNVNFQGAKLSATSFTSANLTGANLSATQMVLMDISDAILKDVNSNNGSIINSTFDYGDLAKTNFSQPVI